VIVHDVEQGSEQWFALRRGIPTASQFGRIFTGGGKASAQRDDYIHELVAQFHCPEIPAEEPYISKAMERGMMLEAEARAWYCLDQRRDVTRVGFLTTACGRFGGSPDALVSDIGCLEIKCPQPKTHVGYCLRGVLPTEYKPQVHGYLWLTGLLWCDFLSYCPGLPPLLVRVAPDDYTGALGKALEAFHADYLIARDAIGQKLETGYEES